MFAMGSIRKTKPAAQFVMADIAFPDASAPGLERIDEQCYKEIALRPAGRGSLQRGVASVAGMATALRPSIRAFRPGRSGI
jgi:hypothetical protein